MSRRKPELTARWPSGRKVEAGRDALNFLAAEAERHGETFVGLRHALAQNTPAARVLLAKMGLTHEALFGPGRPKDTPRLLLINAVVRDLMEAGRTEAQAFKEAPPYLADPQLRKKHDVGAALQGTAHGKGGSRPDMTPGAVADAYRDFQSKWPHLFFDEIADEEGVEADGRPDAIEADGRDPSAG
ncbi:hypothetical protein LOK46_07900 [Methylobacterium sp. NMS14P]|uniref:hypothetical protein n=1 Tax=Methylobacterium sp. NMS14P TaxID=2894310 RepID=UPI00235915D1|nr:hypothetical protein [Methylobacterium sp. NMS14P]WCS26736.1 hypothetical protein LOK46_07900 [Methylobacterium sp. NMS14P]